jgi:Fibronectin type III domain
MRARWVWVGAPIAVLVVLIALFAIDRAVEAQPPNPPTGVTTKANGTAQVVQFVPPGDHGDSEITGYTATCTSDDGGATKTVSGKASPIVVAGMSTGKTYTCAVAATNNAGTSGDSERSAPFVFKTKPGAPSPVSAVPWQSGVARVIWGAPANGGTSITGYVVKPFRGSNPEPPVTFNSTATAQLIKGLPVGRTYQFQVSAKNALGTSKPSNKTAPITVGTPGQPQNAKAVRVSSGSLRVTFTAPANNGATITSYTARCNSSDGGASRTQTKTLTPTNSSAQVTNSGLTAGKTYTCVVKATNSRGTGPVSSPTPAVKA